VIGFIYELVGPVTFPLYSIQMYPSFVALIQTQAKRIMEHGVTENLTEVEIYKQMLHKMETYVLKRTLKMIATDLDELINKPGCDASNMYDEEAQQNEQEFSDDEQEREYKKARKQKKEKRDGPKDMIGNKRNKSRD